MNFHIIFVHFPIAILTVYGLLELVRVKKILLRPYWFHLKAFLVVIGSGSAVLAYATGSLIEDEFRGRLVETHSFFGGLTIAYFGAIALLYFCAWLGREQFLPADKFGKSLARIERFLAGAWMPLFALIGLTIVTITGALGGAIAYGPDIDPVSKFVYALFGF